MNKAQAEKLLKILEELSDKTPVVAGLHSDIKNVYIPGMASLGIDYTAVWDASIQARLTMLQASAPAAQHLLFTKAIAYVPKHSGDPLPRILFGQIRIASNFQGARTVNQEAIVGFPLEEVVGRPLVTVAGMMTTGEIGTDAIPLQVFYDDKSKAWVAANNRGYAAHCLAGKRPLRLWPRLPDTMERNRLEEVEGKGDIGRFTYEGHVHPRPIRFPHSLPSRHIPMTDGPNSWRVTGIASVPD